MSVSRDRVLIDANSVGHAAHRGTILKSGDQETQAIFGFIRTMRALRVRHPDATIIVLWDGRSWRKDVEPVGDKLYKGNREDSPEKIAERKRYKSQTPYIRRALKLLGIPQLFALNLEADDLAGHLAQRYVAQGSLVRLVSGDQDWIQLVGPSCIWEDHREEVRKVNVKSFEKFTGVSTPRQFVQMKALTGDISDNLPGVGGIGDVKALQIMQVWGSVEAFLADPNPEPTFVEKVTVEEGKKQPKTMPKVMKAFHANEDGAQERFAHNMRMMSLIDGHAPEPTQMTLLKGDFDEAGFKTLCHELGFSSIYIEPAFDTFVGPFRKH